MKNMRSLLLLLISILSLQSFSQSEAVNEILLYGNKKIRLADGTFTKYREGGPFNTLYKIYEISADSSGYGTLYMDSTEIKLYTVLSSLNTPPGSPVSGATYLVGNSPTGAWSTRAKDIALWNGSAWVYTDAVQGDYLYNTSNSSTYQFRTGSWQQTGGIPALNGGNTISSGITIGTNNAFSFNFETNNTRAARIDSAQRFHIYNLPNASDTLLLTADINGKLGTVNVRKFIDSIYYKRTIAQLRAAMSAKTLKKGAKYEATDFTTIYDQPDFDDEGNPKTSVVTKTASVEPLVFTANSDSTFDNYVSSTIYNTDIIKFDWTYTETEVMGVAAKGKIIYREDILGNRLDYDYRTVLFKRYRDGANGYSVWFDNDSVSAEFPTFDFDNYLIRHTSILGFETVHDLDVIGIPFHLSNNVFRKNSLFNKMDNVYCNTFMDNAHEVVVGDGIVAMTCLGGIYYSYFGHDAFLVTFLGNSENNYFGDQLLNCVFGARCNDNSIWDKMTNFTAGEDFKRNIQYGDWSNSEVGDAFTDGVIYGLTDSITCGDNNFKIEFKSALAITIGDNNSNIAFGGTKHIMPLNDINGVKNVAFGGSIDGYNWVNGITPALHPEMYESTTKTIVKTPNGNVYTRYLNNALTDVITIIN